MFLRVYKEFFVGGEVVLEKVEKGDKAGYVMQEGKSFGYRVRGEQQQDVKERMYGFWGRELFLLTMKALRERLTASKKNRAGMKAQQAEQQAERACAAAATRRQRAAAAIGAIETMAAAAATAGGSVQQTDQKRGRAAGASPPRRGTSSNARPGPGRKAPPAASQAEEQEGLLRTCRGGERARAPVPLLERGAR